MTYTDTVTVRSYDGTENTLSVKIIGTNDAAVITGDTSGRLILSDSANRIGGKLNATDADNSATFEEQALSGRYGELRIGKDGAWNYVMDPAHSKFEPGRNIPKPSPCVRPTARRNF